MDQITVFIFLFLFLNNKITVFILLKHDSEKGKRKKGVVFLNQSYCEESPYYKIKQLRVQYARVQLGGTKGSCVMLSSPPF